MITRLIYPFVKLLKLPHLLIFLLGFITLFEAVGQKKNIFFDHVTYKEGLNQNTVYTIYADVEGFIWVGTQAGLMKYTGRKFREIPDFIGDLVYAITGDGNGNIWVGSNKGLFLSSGKTDSFREISSLKANQVNHILNLDTALAVSAKDGFYIINKSTGSVIRKENEIIGYVSESSKYGPDLCLAADSGLFVYSKGGQLQRITPQNTKSNRFTSLLCDKNFLFVGNAEGQVFRIGTNEPAQREVCSTEIHDMAFDQNGDIWIGTGQGAIIVNRNLESIDSLYKSPHDLGGLSDNTIYSIYKDQKDYMWLGTRIWGINRYDYRKQFFEYHFDDPYNAHSIDDDFVWGFERFEDEVLVGTNYAGIQVFDPQTGSFKASSKWNSFSKKSVQSLYTSGNGTLWVGVENEGFYYMNDTLSKPSYLPWKGANIKDFLTIDDYTFISGYKYGLKIFDHKSGKVVQSLLRDTYVYKIFHDEEQKVLWLGTVGAGLVKYDLTTGEVSAVKDLCVDDNRCFTYVLSIANNPFDSDVLLLGTNEGGLVFYSKSLGVLKNLTYIDGLPSNTVYGIVPGYQKNNVWLSTARGISKFDLNTESFENFDSSHGLRELEFNGGSYFRDDTDSMIYMGSILGMVRYDPSNINRTYPTSKVILSDVLMDGKKQDSIGYNLDSVINIRVPIDVSQLSLEFDALELSFPNDVKFKIIEESQGTLEEGIYNVSDNIVSEEIKITAYHHFNESVADHLNVRIEVFKPPYYNAKIILNAFLWLLIALIISTLVGFWVYKYRKKRLTLDLELKFRDKINEVSRCEDNNEIIKLVLDELVDGYFDFDYAAFSRIDWLQDTISLESSKKKERVKVDPQKWKHLSIYNLHDEEKDILKLALQEGNAYRIQNDRILEIEEEDKKNGKKNLVEKENPSLFVEEYLNYEIWNDPRYFHKELDRVFFPVKYPQQKEYVFGVVEVGFHRPESKLKLEDFKYPSLAVYLDNCAQPYHRNFARDGRHSVNSILEGFNKELRETRITEEEALDQMVSKSLSWMLEEFNADMVIIDFLPFDVVQPVVQKGKESGRLKSNEKEELRDRILELAFENGRRKKRNQIHNPQRYRYFIAERSEIRSKTQMNDLISELDSYYLVRLNSYGERVGILKLYSRQLKFTIQKISFLRHFVDTFTKFLFKERNELFISKIIPPLNIVEESENEPVYIKVLQQLYQAKSISVWKRSPDSEDEFELSYSSDDLSDGIGRDKVYAEKFEEADSTQAKAITFAWKDFSNAVCIPLAIEEFFIGYILLHSCKSQLLVDRNSANFRKLLSDKVAHTINNNSLIETLREMTSGIVPEGEIMEEDILYKMAKEAKKRLFAHQVFIFENISGQLYFENAAFAGELSENSSKLRGFLKKGGTSHRAKLAEYFVERNEDFWFRNRDELETNTKTYRRDKDGFTKDFWQREELKSSAALRILDDGKIVGFMFLNYKFPKSFSDYEKSFINAFSSLSGLALGIYKMMKTHSEFYSTAINIDHFAVEGDYLHSRLHDIKNTLAGSVIQQEQIHSKIKYEQSILRHDAGRFIVHISEPLIESRNELQEILENWGTDIIKYEEIILGELWNEVLNRFPYDNKKKRIELLPLEGVGADFSKITIKADRSRIRHVLVNLVINAIHAVPEKNGKVEFKAKVKGKKIELVVRDNGPGLDESVDSETIFLPRVSTKKNQGGSGYGLAISRYIISRHHGTIDFSREKNWTVFRIIIPAIGSIEN